jgi:hypothetical protein
MSHSELSLEFVPEVADVAGHLGLFYWRAEWLSRWVIDRVYSKECRTGYKIQGQAG